jgi:GDP-4-dehydro-6-deoxy-D-mannose reductase
VGVLVTGASGFVGAHLLRALAEQGRREIVAATVGDVVPSGSPEGVRWIELDVSSTASVAAAVRESRPTQIYHLAGQSSVSRSFAAPLETWEVNATGTLRLVEALRSAGCRDARVLLISSAEVYGAVDVAVQPIREETPLRPITPYGASKAAAEAAAIQAAAQGLDVVIARSFNHVGPGQDERFALPSMARQLVAIRDGAGEPVLRVGNLEVDRDFLDVRDVVEAYLRLMDRGVSGVAYNVCSGVARSLRSVVAELVELSGTGARVEVDAERVRPADIPLLVGDASRLRSLGWEPEFALPRTLRDLLDGAARRASASEHGP